MGNQLTEATEAWSSSYAFLYMKEVFNKPNFAKNI